MTFIFNPDFSWVPFHVVACSSEEFGTSTELISTQPYPTNRSWESSRTATFPQEIIIRFNNRCEIDHVVLSCKVDRNIPEVEFHIGDGLSGSWLDVEYRLAGKAYNVADGLSQLKLNNGFGAYMKLVVPKPPKRSHKNPYGQISIGALKFWGRFSAYQHGVKNDALPLSYENSEVEKVLIGMGIPLDLLAWFEQGERNFEYSPVDEDTRQTLMDLDKKRDKYRLAEDFEGLKQITVDIKLVFDIGRDIWTCQKDLNFAIATENFNQALELKARLKKLKDKRDTYDALYETSRYEAMIVMQRPNTADIMEKQRRLMEDQENERRRRELEEQERRRLLEEEQRRLQAKKDEPAIQGGVKDTPWWEKSGGEDVGRHKKKKKKEEKEEVIDTGFNNPFNWNEGDVDLDLYFRPLLANAGEQLKDIPLEVLRRLQHLGYLNIFGARLWTAAYSDNWRIREAAAQAVLNFLEMPILEKYLNGRSKKLFLASLEVAKIACEDKLLQIYFIGLKILSTALAPPICGTDVSPQIINKAIKEFLPILIEKISELNFRARDISLHTLISLFRHPALQVGNLVVACMDICDFGDDIRPKNPTPIDKQQWRLVLARLEIILHICQEYGYDSSSWNWQPVFQYLITPSFFHSNLDVRLLAIELTVTLYQYLGQEVRVAIDAIDNMKPNLLSQILRRLDETDILMAQGQDLKEPQINNGGLDRVEEEKEEQTPPGSAADDRRGRGTSAKKNTSQSRDKLKTPGDIKRGSPSPKNKDDSKSVKTNSKNSEATPKNDTKANPTEKSAPSQKSVATPKNDKSDVKSDAKSDKNDKSMTSPKSDVSANQPKQENDSVNATPKDEKKKGGFFSKWGKKDK